METLSSPPDTIAAKKLKLAEDSMSLDMVTSSTVDDPDMMEEDDVLLNEEEDVDVDDASSTYDYDEDDFSAYDETLSLQAQFDAADLPPGVEASVPWLEESDEFKKVGATVPNDSSCSLTDIEQERINEQLRLESILKNYTEFKTFDTVQDYSGHHYLKQASTAKQPARDWAKTIQNEWKLLENGLPETIFVRVYEEKMELLRAVMIGATGTPYHDGLFFFDCFFPATYPNTPPLVHYHSGGLRLNPNLYACGKVCLSLLGTWHGRDNENWIPGKSTMLQVLLSIQALVLNEKPYFNEPGYERTAGQVHGEKQAKHYNENTFIHSIRTMGYSLNKPPKYFEDYVYGHFRVRAHSILEACKEYLKGAEVGSHVETEAEEEGGEQEAEDILSDKKTFLKKFREDLSVVVGNLIPVLIKNGAMDCEKYIPLGDIKRKAPLKI